LTAEQSVRLALVDNVDRQRLIEMIAAHLRRDARTHAASWGGSPQRAYAASLGDVFHQQHKPGR
jgi:hypothetical protein